MKLNALLEANSYRRTIEANPLKVQSTPTIIPRLGQLLKSVPCLHKSVLQRSNLTIIIVQKPEGANR
jgi:hypothetical protein